MTDYYAIEGEGGIKQLVLGPMTVDWHSFQGSVQLKIRAGNNQVTVYSSKTGRSVRVFDAQGEVVNDWRTTLLRLRKELDQ